MVLVLVLVVVSTVAVAVAAAEAVVQVEEEKEKEEEEEEEEEDGGGEGQVEQADKGVRLQDKGCDGKGARLVVASPRRRGLAIRAPGRRCGESGL